ncbi:MAG: hypothetical protein E7491_05545 [Ruminococcaceae bacterium]|nr:hypothetical protein [Oscillospiraceae bacterium]
MSDNYNQKKPVRRDSAGKNVPHSNQRPTNVKRKKRKKRSRFNIGMILFPILIIAAIICVVKVFDKWDISSMIVGGQPTSAPTATLAPNTTPTPTSANAPDVTPSALKGAVIINEVMAKNSNGLSDSDGEYSDWIEIYNGSDSPVSLENLYLSDDSLKPLQWRLPAIILEPNDYIVVFASGKDRSTTDAELHTNFKLSYGETVLLSDGAGTISFVTVPESIDNISYGWTTDDEGHYAFFASPSPNAENIGAHAVSLSELSVSDIGLYINEYMTKNVYTLYDEDGDACDWVEIYNSSAEPISLKNFGLSDELTDPLKWTFPDVTIAPDEHILLYLSGKTKEYDSSTGKIHVDFRLGELDTQLVLSNPGGIPADIISLVRTPDNVSVGRSASDINAWEFFAIPTPGKANGNGYTSLENYNIALTERLYISEVCSVSSHIVSGLPDDDWIELFNNTPDPVNLQGYGLSKDLSSPWLFTFPDVTIAPYSYLVVSASGVENLKKSALSAGFKVGFSGETIILTAPDGLIADSFDTGRQRANNTSGRILENNALVRRFFSSPTKGTANTATAYTGFAQPAVIEQSGGVLSSDSITVTLSTNQQGGSIHYTTDGTVPTASSPKYTAPITVSKSCSLRAVVFGSGLLPSDTATRSFLIEDPHELPVVCLTTDPDNLFDYNTGIFADGPGWTETFPHQGANFWKDWERPVHFEYYEADGTLGVEFDAGIKNFGQYSRAEKQKSVSINLKEAYGTSEVWYPFFEDNDVKTFKSLILRISGQDWNVSKLRDAYIVRTIKGQMDLVYMDVQPVAVYINGEYWGLYNLREKIDESYFYYHDGIEEDNIDIIKANSNVKAGSITEYKELLAYLDDHNLNLSKQEDFDYVASKIDLEEWTNYWIVETFYGNTDTGNIKFYKEKGDEGKWRWVLFDLDWALWPSTYTWNTLEDIIDKKGHGVNKAFSTKIARALLSNEDFKEQFIDAYVYHVKNTFDPDRLNDILNEFCDEIRSEIPRQAERWGAPKLSSWEKNIERIRKIIYEKPDIAYENIQETFGLSDSEMKKLFAD